MPDEGHRCFIAIPLPDHVKKELKSAQQVFRSHKAVHAGFPSSHGFHLTLNFFGEICPEIIQKLKQVICEVISQTPPFYLKISNLGIFPGKGKAPRILWAGLEGDITRLEQIHAGIREQLPIIGIPKGKQRYSPHITLVRFKGKPGQALLNRLIHEAEPRLTDGGFHVNSIDLYKSELFSGGAVHTLLKKFELN